MTVHQNFLHKNYNSAKQQMNGLQQPTLSSLWNTFLVISSLIIGFATFGNTIIWNFKRFWGASADFWETQWDRFLDVTGADIFIAWVYGTTLVTMAVYWIASIAYMIMDFTKKPAVLQRYKIQPEVNESIDKKRLMKVIGWVLFNQIMIGAPYAHLSYILMDWRGMPPLRELPAFHWVLIEIAVCMAVQDVAFFYSHRFLHNRYIYQHIHFWHHEWTAPIAVTASYCHPLEHIISNLTPLLLGPLIMGSHVITSWLWFSSAICATVNYHSGYHFPFYVSPEAHYFHHIKINQFFSAYGILDHIYGTDVLFRKSIAYVRHRVLFNLIPAREAFPDEIKQPNSQSKKSL